MRTPTEKKQEQICDCDLQELIRIAYDEAEKSKDRRVWNIAKFSDKEYTVFCEKHWAHVPFTI